MRLIKRQTTNSRSIVGRGVSYDVNDQIIMYSNTGVQLPRGTEAERPFYPVNGYVRYNTDDEQLEAYQNGAWREIRFKEPNQDPGIVIQTFGPGDAVETDFGTLNSGDTDFPIPAAEQNILVFVENVFQIPNTNYTLVQNPSGKPAGWYIRFGTEIPFGKFITVIHNFDK